MKEIFGDNKQASVLLQQRLQGLQLLQKVSRYQEQVSQLQRLLKSNMANIYDNKMAKADKLIEAMTMLDTSRIVARGYAMLEQAGRVIDSVEKIEKDEQLTIVMKDGRVDVEVKDVQKNENI